MRPSSGDYRGSDKVHESRCPRANDLTVEINDDISERRTNVAIREAFREVFGGELKGLGVGIGQRERSTSAARLSCFGERTNDKADCRGYEEKFKLNIEINVLCSNLTAYW